LYKIGKKQTKFNKYNIIKNIKKYNLKNKI